MRDKKKLVFSLALIFILNILIIVCAQSMSGMSAAPYKRVSVGQAVTQIQQKPAPRVRLSGGVFGGYWRFNP